MSQNDAFDKLSVNKYTINFEILRVLKEAQLSHGLKHGDYQRYRQYCSRRLRRIRRSLHFVQSSGGKTRSSFQAKKVSAQLVLEARKVNRDPIRYLSIPLICAERSWAHAMQLKQEANTEPRKKFHLVNLLKKAVKWSQSLHNICNIDVCDARTKLEASAYCSYFNGLFFFEMDQWHKAVDHLKKAQTIYQKLFEAIADEDIAIHYKQRCDEISPTLRYCAFNIGEQNIQTQDFINKLQTEANEVEDELLSTKLDQLIIQTREKQSLTLSEVQFLGKTLAIKQEKIRLFLHLMQDLELTKLTKTSQLEKMLFECRDCLQLLRESNQEKSPLYYYLSYLRLDLTRKRNLHFIKTLHIPTDLIRPYEIIIGSLTEIQALPFEEHFTSSELIEKFRKEIDAQITVYKAYRCFFIGNVAKYSWKESAALLHRSAYYCETALNDENTPKDIIADLKQLLAKAEANKFMIYANSLMKDESSSETKIKTNIPLLINRLDAYHEDNNIQSNACPFVQFPPGFQPISCKPLFFDLALNRITFPSLEKEKTFNKAVGITGFVKGWLGGWRK